jgi:lysozyme
MKTGARGLALIKAFEGLRLTTYRDAAGILTIGFGHTAAAGPPKPRPGLRITAGEAQALLVRDLDRYETAVAAALRRPPAQDQFDAMVSLCFNIGPGNFARSRVVRAFNAGDDLKAAQAFLGWTQAGGGSLAGLRRRRLAESRLFLGRTAPAKWAVAGSGGALAGGGLAYRFGEAALDSLGYSVGNLMSLQALGVIALCSGVLAVAVLAFMGHERRETLWNRFFAGWLA